MSGDSTRRLQRELDRIFASLGHGMYVVDKDRRVMLWNRAAESILGWTQEEALGRSCRDYVGHVDDAGHELCDEKCPLVTSIGESHTIFAGTVWGMSKDGRRVPVNVSCAPLIDDDDQVIGAVEVFSDMTHEKQVEEFKNSMVSVVAHELRTPLTSMKGYLELVTEGDVGEVNDKQREFLNIVDSNVVRLEDLVNDLLDMGRLESGRVVVHWEPLDLGQMVRDSVQTFKPMAEKRGLELKYEPGSVPLVQGDSQLIGRVLSNLVSNAIKYTNEGTVRIRVRELGDSVVMEVEDTGVGIPEEEIDRVLERFYRASTASQTGSAGSGLGLAIVGEILNKHGGTLELDSEVGRGTCFTVTLPRGGESAILESARGGEHE